MYDSYSQHIVWYLLGSYFNRITLYYTVVVQADLFNEVHPGPGMPKGAPLGGTPPRRTRSTTSGEPP